MADPRLIADRRTAVVGGIASGLIAGLVLALFMLLVALIRGEDVWTGMKVAAHPLLGERALEPGFEAGPVALGVVDHLLVSIGWGLLFALIIHGAALASTVAFGVIWGVIVWLGMYYVVLPIVGSGEIAQAQPVGMAVLTHVLFGLTLALAYLPFQRTVAEPERLAPRPGAEAEGGAAPAP